MGTMWKWKCVAAVVVTIVIAFAATHRMDVNMNGARVAPLDVKTTEMQD